MLLRSPTSTLFPYTTLFRSSRMILQVHDELVLEVPHPERETATELVKSHMEGAAQLRVPLVVRDRKSTRLNSSHQIISYAVFCLKKKKIKNRSIHQQTWSRQ